MASQQRRFTRFARTIALAATALIALSACSAARRRRRRLRSRIHPRRAGQGQPHNRVGGCIPRTGDRSLPGEVSRHRRECRDVRRERQRLGELPDQDRALRPGRRGVARCRLLHTEQRRVVGFQGDQRRSGLRGPRQQGVVRSRLPRRLHRRRSLDPLTVDGTVYGLRNDLAQSVFWYNQALFDQFGYEIPTTWEEYEQLSDKLAAEHPGYILGSVGDAFLGMLVYYWGAQAPDFPTRRRHVQQRHLG